MFEPHPICLLALKLQTTLLEEAELVTELIKVVTLFMLGDFCVIILRECNRTALCARCTGKDHTSARIVLSEKSL